MGDGSWKVSITRHHLETVFTGIMAVASLAIALAVLGNRRPPPPPPPPSTPTEEKDWKSFTTRGERIGPADARVVIVEFSDFQCPFCRRLRINLDTILARYPRDVAVLYRHYPIPSLHRYASTAAHASICAGRQGRFRPYHDALYERQDSIGKIPWTGFASRAGVGDTAAFQTCLKDSTVASLVMEDLDAGRRLKIRGTPTVLVNRWRVRGASTVAALDELIRRELK